MSADEFFQGVVRPVMNACLKQHQFTRSGNVFRRQRTEVCQVVSLVKSGKTTSDLAVFTVELGVASLRLLARSGVDSRRCSIEDCHWRERLGMLGPRREDVWWTVRDEPSAHSASTEIVAWMESAGLPALEGVADDSALRDVWVSDRSPGLTDVQRLLCLSVLLETLGPRSTMVEVTGELKRMVAAKPIPAIVTRLRELGECP